MHNILFLHCYCFFGAGGTTPAMVAPKFWEPAARKLSARAEINVNHQKLAISYQRDPEMKTLTTFKWSNPIAVSNYFGSWLVFKQVSDTTKLRDRRRHFESKNPMHVKCLYFQIFSYRLPPPPPFTNVKLFYIP